MNPKAKALLLVEAKIPRLVTQYRRLALADPAAPATMAAYRELGAAVATFRRLRGPLPEET